MAPAALRHVHAAPAAPLAPMSDTQQGRARSNARAACALLTGILGASLLLPLPGSDGGHRPSAVRLPFLQPDGPALPRLRPDTGVRLSGARAVRPSPCTGTRIGWLVFAVCRAALGHAAGLTWAYGRGVILPDIVASGYRPRWSWAGRRRPTAGRSDRVSGRTLAAPSARISRSRGRCREGTEGLVPATGTARSS